MKIQYASDLHLEFRNNESFLEENPLDPKGDILVLAGDIIQLNDSGKSKKFFDIISEQFKEIFLIPGNHEFYNKSMDINEIFPMDIHIRKNVRYLNNRAIELEGIRIIFTTLFTKITKHILIGTGMNDFRQCLFDGEKFTTKIYNDCHQECINFLVRELDKSFDGKTIVVSHHAPYPPDYCNYNFNSELNEGFHVDMSWMPYKYKIDHWISGHTHHNLESFQIGETWFHTNQLGYTFRDEHEQFRNDALINT